MKAAGQRLWQHILDQNDGNNNESSDMLDAAVSFDGTWAKRGFTSLTGIVFVISLDTGEVLDYHALSKFCQTCDLKTSRCKSDEEFQEWHIEHLASGECDINFGGSSPAMEAEGAVIMWNRSLQLHNIRYRWMVSDGDSNAFNVVEETYNECRFEKLDCVGHVQKHMGKHLMNLKAKTKGKLTDGKPIGGQGCLSEANIKKFQRFYGLAIRQNTLTTANPTEREISVAVYSMKRNIIATLNHCVKAENIEKQHQFCPPGVSGSKIWPQENPPTMMVTAYLKSFLSYCTPHMTLSETKLLEKCVHGTTQNRNECINSLVWVHCPKHKHHGVKVIRCAVASAVLHFHGGAASR